MNQESKGTYFICGTYGVGKSTICKKISKITCISEFSAGDLISGKNGEEYGAKKFVNDKDRNQDILIKVVNDILQENYSILLAGHFCIFNRQNEVEILPEKVFRELSISKIILLEADLEIIACNLSCRDGKSYSIDDLRTLQIQERRQAELVSNKLSVPLLIHEMKFDDLDSRKLIDFILN